MDDKLKKSQPDCAELSDDALDQVAGGIISIPEDRFYDPFTDPEPLPEPPLPYPELPGDDFFNP